MASIQKIPDSGQIINLPQQEEKLQSDPALQISRGLSSQEDSQIRAGKMLQNDLRPALQDLCMDKISKALMAHEVGLHLPAPPPECSLKSDVLYARHF